MANMRLFKKECAAFNPFREKEWMALTSEILLRHLAINLSQ
jgi:hypothetical protein